MAQLRPLYLTNPVVRPPFRAFERRSARLGYLLRVAGFIDRPQLRQALIRRQAANIPLGAVLTHGGIVPPHVVTHALAKQWRLEMINPITDPPDADLLCRIDPEVCIRLGCLPWRSHNGRILIALSDPTAPERAIEACGCGHDNVAFVGAARAQIISVLSLSHRAALEHKARHQCPTKFSCRNWSARNLLIILCVLTGLLTLATSIAPTTAFWLIFAWILTFNLGAATMRLAALYTQLGDSDRAQSALPDAKVTKLSDHRERPVVSLLVPLHREEKVLPSLLSHLDAINYPAEALDVLLLVEEHDHITTAALARLPSLGGAQVILVSEHRLKTKPRALNYGLTFCRGDVVGVLDAEDRPHPDQISTVIEHLWHAPREVAAVQARLDFYNPRRNWMSRIFTLEYAIWFNVLMKGMRALDLPIPLGGTSIYFRRKTLERLGAWDAHNVTEDAELGMRIARAGLRTEIVPSVTMEEANGQFISWIKQRSRWIKGYLITWAVHMRRPADLYKDLGLKGFLAFQVLFLGGVTSYLCGPILLGLWAIGVASSGKFLPDAAPIVWQMAVISMVLGQLVMLLVAIAACTDRDKRFLLPWIITAPLYWQIGAFAALKAVAEMFYRPFFWDKTAHGDQSDQTTVNDASPIELMETEMPHGSAIGNSGM